MFSLKAHEPLNSGSYEDSSDKDAENCVLPAGIDSCLYSDQDVACGWAEFMEWVRASEYSEMMDEMLEEYCKSVEKQTHALLKEKALALQRAEEITATLRKHMQERAEATEGGIFDWSSPNPYSVDDEFAELTIN